MYCSKCGAELVENARFCGKCGNPTKSTPVSQPFAKACTEAFDHDQITDTTYTAPAAEASTTQQYQPTIAPNVQTPPPQTTTPLHQNPVKPQYFSKSAARPKVANRSRSIVTAAIAIVVIQLFCFFLPSFAKYEDDTRNASYSMLQTLDNHTDTLDDRSAKELWSDCSTARTVCCICYIFALVLLVNATRQDDKKAQNALITLFLASALISFAVVFNYITLDSIFEEVSSDTSAELLFVGIIEAAMPLSILCMLSPAVGSTTSRFGKKPQDKQTMSQDLISSEEYQHTISGINRR